MLSPWGLKEPDTTWQVSKSNNSTYGVWTTGYLYLRAQTLGHYSRAQLVSGALNSSSGQIHFLRFPFLKRKQCMVHIYCCKQHTIDHISALKSSPPRGPVLCAALSCSAMSDSATPGLYPARLLYPWDFPGRNIAVVCYFPLQGIFPTQGWHPRLLCLLHWQGGS